MKKYALITGASKGIGRSIAFELAKRRFDLLLTARSAEELSALQQEIGSRYQVDVRCYPADLSAPDTARAIGDWIAEHSFNVSVLINNAGYGLWGPFEELGLEEQLNMVRLNISSLTELTHRVLPDLKRHTPSYILNVASTAAYQAVPTLAVYSASKAFVLSFTRAIRYELKGSGVSVSCLSPGPVDTGFAARAGMSALAKLNEKFSMQPDEVAETAVRGLFRRKAEIIPGLLNRITALSGRILPKSLIENTAGKLYRKR